MYYLKRVSKKEEIGKPRFVNGYLFLSRNNVIWETKVNLDLYVRYHNNPNYYIEYASEEEIKQFKLFKKLSQV